MNNVVLAQGTVKQTVAVPFGWAAFGTVTNVSIIFTLMTVANSSSDQSNNLWWRVCGY